ncbi:MAG: hypothetical protein C5B49_03105 [Bdellovibrio sp.]|nr:MAG: hypothetical protein C5B49_03105 [Bdellovibrio sp.]
MTWFLSLSHILVFGLLNWGPAQAWGAGGPHVDHFFLVVMENEDPSMVMRSSFFRELKSQSVYFEQMTGETHPSQPNYIAMVAGDTHGVDNDKNVDLNVEHLGDLLERKGLDWRSYAEDLPGSCFLGAKNGVYARRHVPFLSFTNVTGNPARCAAKIRDFNDLERDLAAGQVPEFSFITPNNIHNGHDSSVQTTASWLADYLLPRLKSAPLQRTIVIITYDEGWRLGDNRIATFLVGEPLRPGLSIHKPANHYTLLRMIEDEFALGNLGRNDKDAPVVDEIWK